MNFVNGMSQPLVKIMPTEKQTSNGYFLYRFAALNYDRCGKLKKDQSLAEIAKVKRPLVSGKMYAPSGFATKDVAGKRKSSFLTDCISQRIAEVATSHSLEKEIFFLSPEWVLVSSNGLQKLKLEVLKKISASRKIQRWWRRRCAALRRRSSRQGLCFRSLSTSFIN